MYLSFNEKYYPGDMEMCECGHSCLYHERMVGIKNRNDCICCHCKKYNQADWITGLCIIPEKMDGVSISRPHVCNA